MQGEACEFGQQPGADQDEGCPRWEELHVFTWESFFRNLCLGPACTETAALEFAERLGSCGLVKQYFDAQIILVVAFGQCKTYIWLSWGQICYSLSFSHKGIFELMEEEGSRRQGGGRWELSVYAGPLVPLFSLPKGREHMPCNLMIGAIHWCFGAILIYSVNETTKMMGFDLGAGYSQE